MISQVASNKSDSTDLDLTRNDLCWQKFKLRFNEIVRDVIRFAKAIPGFAELDLEDQISLLKGGGFEVRFLECQVGSKLSSRISN